MEKLHYVTDGLWMSDESGWRYHTASAPSNPKHRNVLHSQGCIKLVPPAPGLRNPKARDPKSETNPKPEARRCATTTRRAWIFDGPFAVRTSGLFRISGLRISGFRPSPARVSLRA